MFDQDIIMKLKDQKEILEAEMRLHNIDKKRIKRGASPFIMGGWGIGRTVAATRQSLADRIMDEARSVRAVTIVGVGTRKIEVHIRLAWWAVFGFGLVHRLARKRVRHVISNSKAVQVDVKLKRVGVFV